MGLYAKKKPEPDFVADDQQRRGSTCVSAQSDHRLLESILVKLDSSKILRLSLIYVAQQIGLSLTWLETPKTGFFRVEAQITCYE